VLVKTNDIMNVSFKIVKYITIILVSVFFSIQFTFSQTFTLNNDTSFMEVHGTSSLHDWHVDVLEQGGKIAIKDSINLIITTLNFNAKSESLKSGKKGMDKNTYKALKTDDYKSIDFKLSSVERIEFLSDSNYKVSIIGNMKISGVTNSVKIDFRIKLDKNKILIEGEKSLLMTDYGIDPPKALLGTIKTGNEIKIVFKLVFGK
jgi:YceI-like domain